MDISEQGMDTVCGQPGSTHRWLGKPFREVSFELKLNDNMLPHEEDKGGQEQRVGDIWN